MEKFNVINFDFNSKRFEQYDVIPYFIREYNNQVKKYNEYPNDKYWNVPKTFNEFKQFIKDKSQYQFWSRCEYEIVLSPWPYILAPNEGYDTSKENDVETWKEHWKKHLESCDKWDIHDQIMMNIDIITELVMKSI